MTPQKVKVLVTGQTVLGPDMPALAGKTYTVEAAVACSLLDSGKGELVDQRDAQILQAARRSESRFNAAPGWRTQ